MKGNPSQKNMKIVLTDRIISRLLKPNYRLIRKHFPKDIQEDLINELKNISDHVYDLLTDIVVFTAKEKGYEVEVL